MIYSKFKIYASKHFIKGKQKIAYNNKIKKSNKIKTIKI